MERRHGGGPQELRSARTHSRSGVGTTAVRELAREFKETVDVMERRGQTERDAHDALHARLNAADERGVRHLLFAGEAGRHFGGFEAERSLASAGIAVAAGT